MPRAARKKYRADIIWDSYSGQSVIFPVCIRSSGVRGRNLEATLNALSIRGITSLHVVMCDTLDRWNLDVLDPEAAAMHNADLWLLKNRDSLKTKFSLEVRRWNDVRGDPGFAPRLSLMRLIYKENETARSVVDSVADVYLRAKETRCKATGLFFDEGKERCRSTSYLLEEFAGTATYAQWHPQMPEVYWGVYVEDPKIFQKLNTVDPKTDLSLPETLAVHLNRLPLPVAAGLPSPAAA